MINDQLIKVQRSNQLLQLIDQSFYVQIDELTSNSNYELTDQINSTAQLQIHQMLKIYQRLIIKSSINSNQPNQPTNQIQINLKLTNDQIRTTDQINYGSN